MNAVSADNYKDAMRAAICTVCVCNVKDRKNPAQCAHESSGQCSLFANLGAVVEVVSSIHNGSIDDYTEALRRKVCANCEHQDEKGICNVRDSHTPIPTWCVLDAYFNLIVGVVEDVQGVHASTN